MSFRSLPDSMTGYATHELVELLRKLTPAQRVAVGRIVQHVYVDNKPWAHLFVGDNAICREATYYRRGKLDEETGERTNPGWNHQPDFQRAVETAARLALQVQSAEDLHRLRQAKRKAIDRAESAVEQWVSIMRYSQMDFARIQAAGEVVKLAFRDEGSNEEETGVAGDWWQAALEGECDVD